MLFILWLQDQFKIQELVNIADHIHRLKIKIIIWIDEEKHLKNSTSMFDENLVLGMEVAVTKCVCSPQIHMLKS